MKRPRLWLLLALLLVAWLANVSRPGLRPRGCLSGCSNVDSVDDSQLRVLSLNMLHGRPGFAYLDARMDLIADAITSAGADVVLLQEVPWTWRHGDVARLLAERTGMNHAYYRANGNRWAILFEEGEAILSKFPLQDLRWLALKPAAGMFENRVALMATIGTPAGTIDFYVTHLTNGDQKTNAGQAETLHGFVLQRGDRPAVIAGDFNASETEPQMVALGSTWLDAFRSLHPGAQGNTCCIDELRAWHVSGPDKRIDYLFLANGEANGLSVADARLLFDEPSTTGDGWLWASDHLGLLVTLARE